MPPESAVIEAARRLRAEHAAPPRLRALAAPAPRVVDVAPADGRRAAEVRAYLDAKARWAHETGAIEHRVVVPRRALGARALHATLRAAEPDVVLLHDPSRQAVGAARAAHDVGARVVAVHHGAAALRPWRHRACAAADHVMAAAPSREDCGRRPTLTLRAGLHRVFAPQPDVPRGEHVLYAGRLAREHGVLELVHAAARAPERWTLRLVGSGPAQRHVERLAQHLGIADRVRVGPEVRDPHRRARLYAAARVVAVPARSLPGGPIALEAAASGAVLVACTAGDADGLLAAVEAARRTEPDRRASAELAARCSWPGVFAAELADLRRLLAVP